MNQSIMQKALGDQWEQLPAVLKAHYQYDSNEDIGYLDISYPNFMHPYLTVLQVMGALINRRGKNIPTTVKKHMKNNTQYWNREIQFPQNKTVFFNSFWVHHNKNELIEYINPLVGLRLAVGIKDNELHYEGKNFVLKVGKFLLPIPEWLVLGHTTIIEIPLSNRAFKMDFKLVHPIFGTLFRYTGKFETRLK